MIEKKSKTNLDFKGRIKEIEQELLKYQLDLARFSSQSIPLQKIIFSLIMHRRLTQTQLHYLTHLSKSTISTGLSNLINIGHVKKRKITGSKEHLYFVSSVFNETMNHAFGSLENDLRFFEMKQELGADL